MPAFPFSVAAFAATELQFCPHTLKLRLLQVLQLLRSSQLHHGIKDHLHTTSASLSFSPAPLCSSSPAVVLLVRIPLGLPTFPFFSFALHWTHSPPFPFLFLLLILSDPHFYPPFTNLNCFVFRYRALYAPSGVSPAVVPRRQPTLVMLANKHTRNVCLLSAPSDHVARGVLAQDALARTPLWSMMMKPYPRANGHWDLKQADGKDSGQLALFPEVLICPPPLLGHHPTVTSLLDLNKVIIRPMKDGDGKGHSSLGQS
ncbi:hypothetical protein O181_095204 [Austropuccinia psidii MF-1]|uniref:Uncharacterized protein n=1 Tax=Austropuccinia psidii MF-1 TaxID=1389203 RepID=A0A9Q3J4V9_9BASI|nr:hypothetical protein [Austropuccinia psidii MF-1]